VRKPYSVGLLLLMSIAGCGGGDGQTAAPTPTPSAGPHGGPAVPLPDDQGFGEVVIEPESKRGSGLNARVAVYFFKGDLKAPLDTSPTDVRVKLELPGDEPADIALAPEPKAGEAAGAGRFVSKVGPYAFDQTRGALTATVGGQTFTKPFADR
jgi:hypothetical protein